MTPSARLYRPVRWLTRPLWRRWLDLDVVGAENVPRVGPVILAANHLSFIDSPLLMYTLPRRVLFLGKSDYLDHPLARSFFPAAGMIAVERTGRPTHGLRAALGALSDGLAVGVHPEGTRSRDGHLHAGRSGVALLALRSGAPIVPVGIRGTGHVQPVGRLLPRRGRVVVRYGPPVDLGPWVGRGRGATVRAEIMDEVMRAIAALSGQQLSAPVTTG